MAVPVLLYGSKTRTLKKRNLRSIQAAEMKYLKAVECCTRADKLGNEFGVSLCMKTIT
jgi:hypothetical protein